MLFFTITLPLQQIHFGIAWLLEAISFKSNVILFRFWKIQRCFQLQK